MPTSTGGETIGERLTRLRKDLARIRLTIARSETNGAETKMGLGTQITQIAYERALDRESQLAAQIATLERRIVVAPAPARIAELKTVMPGE